MNRRLYRCRHDRKIAGVASGVAEYFELDPTLVRVLWFVSIFFGGFTLLLYIGLAIIVPLEPLSEEAAAAEAAMAAGAGRSFEGHRHAARGSGHWTTLFGATLILLGVIALIDALAPGWESWRYLWPAFVIGVGAFLVAGALRRDSTPREPNGQ